MALAQAERVSRFLTERGHTVDIAPMSTSGDRWAGNLAQLGGKGAFTKEVDGLLLDGQVDIAVHCVKDVPGDQPLPPGTTAAAYLTRDDPRDALVLPAGVPAVKLDALPFGTRVGTSAVRRVMQLAMHWPHLVAVPIRGNANTRLAKLDSGEVDALLLAVAGLERIGAADRIAWPVPVEQMVPAVGAGTLMVLCRQDDTATFTAASALNDPVAWRETQAERMLLHILQGNCHTPIAGYARTEPDGRLSLHARVGSRDGKEVIDVHQWGADPVALATSVAAELMRNGARHLIAIGEDGPDNT